MNDIAVVNNPQSVAPTGPVVQALQDARVMIEKIKVAMVRIYYIFTKTDIQEGLKTVPEVIRTALRKGVREVVRAINTIIEGMTTIREKGYVVIALLKELPNMVDATAELLDEEDARSARRVATIAAFTAVFVDEKYKDIQDMLELFAKLLEAVDGRVDKTYLPGEKLKLTELQLGFDPKTGPTLTPALPAAQTT